MLDANESHHTSNLSQAQPHGVALQAPSKPSPSLLERQREPDWGKHFWDTLAGGLPSIHLLRNPYFPSTEQVKGGWRTIVEQAYRPANNRVSGVTNTRGAFVLTPEEAMNKHAVDTAKRLLTEPPKHFQGPSDQTFFCFLEMGFSMLPDWAVIHREVGAVCLRDDLVLIRPNQETTMEVTVVGPVFQLHPKEVSLWEGVAVHQNRAFLVVEHN